MSFWIRSRSIKKKRKEKKKEKRNLNYLKKRRRWFGKRIQLIIASGITIQIVQMKLKR